MIVNSSLIPRALSCNFSTGLFDVPCGANLRREAEAVQKTVEQSQTNTNVSNLIFIRQGENHTWRLKEKTAKDAKSAKKLLFYGSTRLGLPFVYR